MTLMTTFFAFAALFLATTTTVLAIPKPDQLAERATCTTQGQYYSTVAPVGCRPCPPGSYCDGTNKQLCDYGSFQPIPGKTSCIKTLPGQYQPQRGQILPLPCYLGSYQPYPGQAFCYGAPSGRFQGRLGQAHVCGACCGYATLPGKTNNNTFVYRCSGSTPYSSPDSGAGCVKTDNTQCVVPPSCKQAPDGTCPGHTL
ncbi:hypothetical protein C8F01DRAFT_9450 [Mycena amicta]|nr:hypothetical protein C8F01DRAFT_9450 [Mycena amicta]